MSLLTGMLNPNQKQMLNNFKAQPNEKQAETIARMCNEKGISKDQLAQIISQLKGR